MYKVRLNNIDRLGPKDIRRVHRRLIEYLGSRLALIRFMTLRMKLERKISELGFIDRQQTLTIGFGLTAHCVPQYNPKLGSCDCYQSITI